jgi:hypothetical protein
MKLMCEGTCKGWLPYDCVEGMCRPCAADAISALRARVAELEHALKGVLSVGLPNIEAHGAVARGVFVVARQALAASPSVSKDQDSGDDERGTEAKAATTPKSEPTTTPARGPEEAGLYLRGRTTLGNGRGIGAVLPPRSSEAWEPLDVECPGCQAEPGFSCREGGIPVVGTHISRKNRALRASEYMAQRPTDTSVLDALTKEVPRRGATPEELEIFAEHRRKVAAGAQLAPYPQRTNEATVKNAARDVIAYIRTMNHQPTEVLEAAQRIVAGPSTNDPLRASREKWAGDLPRRVATVEALMSVAPDVPPTPQCADNPRVPTDAAVVLREDFKPNPEVANRVRYLLAARRLAPPEQFWLVTELGIDQDRCWLTFPNLEDALDHKKMYPTMTVVGPYTQRPETARPDEPESFYRLRHAISLAKVKHPGGPDGIRSLVEEVGEVANAMRRETTLRVRSELIDVAVVALRWWEQLGSTPTGSEGA